MMVSKNDTTENALQKEFESLFTREVNSDAAIFLDIPNLQIGRYLFHLIHFLLKVITRIYVRTTLEVYTKMDVYTREKLRDDRVQLVDHLSEDGLVISYYPSRAVNRIQLDFDYYRSKYKKTKSAIFFPFPMHPLQYSFEMPKTKEKRIKVLFAGNIDPNLYQRLPTEFHLLRRHEVIEGIKEKMSSKDLLVIESREHLENELSFHPFLNKIVLLDSRKRIVSPQQWLSILGSSLYFLSLPGVIMPHSHNIVEAMKMGVVPITQYGKYMQPPLDTSNAVTFTNIDDLVEKIKTCLNQPIDAPQWLNQSAECEKYAERYMSEQHFIQEFLELVNNNTVHKRIIMNGEHATVKAYRS